MTEFFPFLTRRVRIRSSVAIAVLGLIVASTAGATPFLEAGAAVSGDFGDCGPAGGNVSSTSTGAPVSARNACSNSRGAGSARGTASIGNLGGEAHAREFGFAGVGFAGGGIYRDAVVFSGPGDAPVPVGIILHFAGTLSTTVGASAGSATVQVRAKINDIFVGALLVTVDGGVATCTIGEVFSPTIFAGVGPCGLVYDTTLRSRLISVPQDTPIGIQLDLTAGAGANEFSSSGESLFADTFGFIVGGPVFDLPAGFTANSPTSFIVNNRFLPAGPVAAVPEPSSMLLAISALGLLGMLRRRRA
jgi:hypothetical protein